jgi:exodeoxyribonuclease V alpha subunit
VLTVLDLEAQSLTVRFDAERVIDYDFADADQLTPAYAVSIHKSQGSEYQAVVIPLVTQHYLLLQRNLLYTAITRARKLCVLVGSRRAIEIAVNNAEQARRFTGLAVRLRG